MSVRRGATELCGILAVDKPEGLTSHDVVNRVRRATGERRVGHAGTLDPMATGLLVVLVGPATRLAPFLTAAEKEYSARVVFGAETDTDDAEGAITVTAPVPDEAGDPFFSAGMVASLVGVHEQLPPNVSAIQRGGQRAYDVARAGGTLAVEPRRIEIVSAALLGMDIDPAVTWDIDVTVSKGTYIRALARDLGRAMDTAAHLGALRRTRSGAIGVAGAHTLEEIEAAEQVAALFTEPLAALGLPVVAVDGEVALRVADGVALRADAVGAGEIEDGARVAIAHDGTLLGVYARTGDLLKADTIIAGGVKGTT